jgi:hypothetical protein
VALVLLALAPAVGRANVIIGNLETGNGSVSPINSKNQAAYSFAMGSQPYTVSDVMITLGGNPPSDTTFQLQSDAIGRPSGNVLVTFIDPPFVNDLGAGTDYTLGVPAPVTLAANVTYWLVGFTGSSSANWVNSKPQTDPSGPGATFVAYALSGDSEATWTNSDSVRPKFQLDGTVNSPEPSSLVLVGTVAGVAAATRGCRRRTEFDN